MSKSFANEIVLSEQLNHIDFVIIIFSLLFCFVLSKLKNSFQDDKEYLLMGKNLGLPLFVATLTSSWYGGIFGVTQLAFEEGIYNFFTQGFSWYFSYVLFALFFVKKIRKNNVTSLPDLIGKKFGPELKKMSAIVLFFHAIPITYSLSLGIFLQAAFGLNLALGIFFGTILVAAYSSIGGLRGIVITDAFQFCLMFFSVMCVVFFCCYNFGFLGFLQQNLPASFFSFAGTYQVSRPLVWLLVACSTTLIHPVFYQRCLAAKDVKTATRGIFISIAFWIVFDLCTTLGGMYARALLPNANSNQAYLSLALQILPHGFRGIFISGVIACILSTMDSFLFVSGTCISHDFKSTTKLSTHKKYIFLSASLSILFAYFFDAKFESIWLLKEGLLSLGLLLPTLAAIFIKEKLDKKIFLIPSILSCSIYFISTLASPDLQHYYFYFSYLIGFTSFLILFKLYQKKVLVAR